MQLRGFPALRAGLTTRPNGRAYRAPLNSGVRSEMTHFVLTRKGYEQLKASFGNFPFAFWVNDGVLSVSELAELRAAGFSVTNFTTVIDPNCSTEVASAVVTIQQHHPNQSIWVEHALGF